MRRFATLLLVAGCSAHAVDDAGVTAASDETQRIVAPQAARHGSTIELIAITDDADAAISQDVRGGTRVWLVFDPATGALTTRTCGWAFGLSTVGPGPTADEDSICEAR